MTIQAQVSRFRPRNYQVFAGLDVDKHSIAVTFCNHEELLRSLRLPYSAAQLLSYVRKHFPQQLLAFAYEAGPTGFGLYDELAAAGHPCLVVAPSMVPQAPGARVKTNRLDSKKLSTAASIGCWVAPKHINQNNARVNSTRVARFKEPRSGDR